MPRLLLLLGMLLIGVAGCGPNVVNMQALNEFPQPLVEPLPVSVGVYFPPEFGSFTHHEERPNVAGGEWTISIGPTQLQVFRTIFAAMFRSVRELDSADAAGEGLAAVIVPSIAEFQFALPADTRATVFEIWIKYDLSIRDGHGAEIGHWQFTAYGKTPTAFLKSSEDAIKAASIIALRDAGASMVSGLERDQRIREWLGVAPATPLAGR
ncbi:MAG: hypothetical protein KA739_05355 [Pseudomonadales bacterium]|nr:hypothetical protein [Gammaproteobacteria bacterium]MBP6051255.1 hypothetical protein [Pseudomonadales bacterium]MBK6581601.1 hypothetical protein [Gammaproteobacteria bacterium]MBK7170452.1 hypothetical protein [Gammaproteobacteria bacterium]MBK7522362.1 hypothetical protein [Gammaproteobacteria bacterium]